MPWQPETVEARLTGAASPQRRCLAACIDFSAAVLIGVLLSSTLGHWAAEGAAEVLQVGEPGAVWRGPVPLMLGAIGNLIYALPIVLFLVILPETILGLGPGKAVTGLCILPAKSARPSRLLWRFLFKTAACLAWFLALSIRQPWTLALFVPSLLLFTIGCLPLLRGGVVLHDRLAQTQVAVKRSHRL